MRGQFLEHLLRNERPTAAFPNCEWLHRQGLPLLNGLDGSLFQEVKDAPTMVGGCVNGLDTDRTGHFRRQSGDAETSVFAWGDDDVSSCVHQETSQTSGLPRRCLQSFAAAP